ncbi:MAG: NAD-dependent epimerase/dehydratase family protein [Acidobacteriota bacterium]
MKVLIIGGTRFIGVRVVRRLIEEGNDVTVFHRGHSKSEIPTSVNHLLGERAALSSFASEFARIAPDVVLDMICYNEQEAETLMRIFRGVARRVVVASSMDVYQAYGCLLGLDAAPPDPMPFNEDSPLRESRFPYRGQAKGPDDMAFNYDKIPVEQVVMSDPDLPGTVLRLPAVYGPGDHRAFDHLKRMEDGRRVILLEEKHARWRWTRGYVDNVAAGIALTVTDDRAANRVYNVGEPDALSEAEWVRSIGRAAGWQGEVVALPKELMPEHLRMPYNLEHHLDGYTSRIRRELGYAEHITRDEAMKQTVEWERAHPPDQVDASRFNYAAEDAALEKLAEPRR